LAPTSPGPAFVEVAHATFRGPDGPVFADTTLAIAPGQRWAIVGPNDSGKGLLTAALMGKLPLLAGRLRHPFLEGDARFADSVFGVLPPGTMALGSMREHRQWLLARDFHQLRWHGSFAWGAATVGALLERNPVESRNAFAVPDPAGEQAFRQAREREIARFELAGLLDRPVVGLSNGELHRFVLVRALLRRPRLLFLDDPLAGLDHHGRERLLAILDALAAEGIGVVVASERAHELPAGITHVARVADRRVVLAGPRAQVAVELPAAAPIPSFPAGALAPSRVPPPGPIAEVHRATVRLGNVTLLEDVTWTIQPGEHWALLGPNGSGKSTLLGLLLADHPQVHANDVRVAGQRLGPGRSIWDQKAWLGWVSPELEGYTSPQASLLEVVLSGFASSLGVHAAVTPAEVAAARACLAGLGIGRHADRRFAEVAPATRRRALLARAVVHGPALLLLDEPCQGLDAAGTQGFLAALAAVTALLAAAMVYVTHAVDEIPASVDRCLVLAGGRVRYLGARAGAAQAMTI
jgi:molybdate transport system ATP-binding protein